MKQLLVRVVSSLVLVGVVGCEDPGESTAQDEAAVVVADGGIPRGSRWSYWDGGGDLGTAWRGASFNDSAWASGAGPLGYGESYLATTVGYGGNAGNKHVTTYFRTQFTVSDPSAVRAIRGDLMYDDGIVIYLNGAEVGRDSMPTGAFDASTFAARHEANNAYTSFDWTAQKPHLRAGVNTIAVEIHQDDAASSDLVFDLGLVLELAPPPPSAGNIARRSTWSYWDRGGDLGSGWRTGSVSSWARGAGPLGYGETYLGTTVGYGGNAAAKHITTYFRRDFTVADPSAVTAMVGELMYDDGVVVYLNGTRIGSESMPSGTITASTLALGHETGNNYVSRDWAAHRGLLVAGVNTIAVEVHQAAPSSSDLTFDLSLTLTTAPPPTGDGIARGSVWTYWDRGGAVGVGWRFPAYDDTTWVNGAGPLGYGESYLRTTVGYGGNPNNKHITTYFRGTFVVDDPGAVTSMLGELIYDDGVVVYLNGTEIARHAMPSGPIIETTRSTGHETGNVYQPHDWSASRRLLVAGENLIAVEVHQAAPTSSDLAFDLALTIEDWHRIPIRERV